jgi:YfiH family protein
MTQRRLGFVPAWSVPHGVRCWVSERAGGVSVGPYAELNLAGHVGDAPTHVAANRARLREAAELPSDPVWLDQQHGTNVLDLDGTPVTVPADGAVASRPGLVCAVLTADCLPVLLCDREGRRIGAAHAGWRGLLHGVLPAAVEALGVAPSDVQAWLGPATGPAAYEVGDDVRDAYLARDPAAARHFTANTRRRWHADLYGLARASLERAGVESIEGGGFCTFNEPKRFFSHRREAPCGRMASLIWIDKPEPIRDFRSSR